MNEQDVKVIPQTEEAREYSPSDTSDIGSSPQRSALMTVLRHALPLGLAGISVAFFSATAVALSSAMGLDGREVTRMMLGEFAGGMSNVVAVSSPGNAATEHHFTTDEQTADSNVPPSQSVTHTDTALPEDYTIELSNETPYEPDMREILSTPRAIPTLDELHAVYGDGAPIVLIIHTHGSEGYADSADTDYRTSDKSKNIVSVGKVISDRLNGAGIAAIHCDTLFDAADFNLAYYNASLKIRETLAAYPSISYIIDVHRDSVLLSDGTYLPLIAEADGESAAQLMFVIGTDHGGSGHTGWRDNLALASRLQYAVYREYPTLMRSINLRSASFNEQYTKGSLLLEVGSCANTLEEAKISAEIFADALIREIIGD